MPRRRRWWPEEGSRRRSLVPWKVIVLLPCLVAAEAPRQLATLEANASANESNENESNESNGTSLVPFDNMSNESSNETDAMDVVELRALVQMLATKVDEQALVIEEDRSRIALLTEDLSAVQVDTDRSIDTGWLLYSTSLVMFMQLGFALVEAGSVRKKSYRHVFLKNLLDFSVGMSLWFLLGYWIAFPGKWEGGELFTFEKFDLFFTAEEASLFAFQTMFSSTSITIVSGAMAERTRMEAYLAFCALCGGMLYSVVVRWTWGGGWLAEMEVPYHDFAGSGVVHATGGVAAFVGAWLVGPRAGRWSDQSTLREDDKYKPHSPDGILMGTLILWFGWFGFNPGSTTSLVGDNASVASVAYVNTMIAPTFSAVTVMLFGVACHSLHKGPNEEKPALFDLGKICNGVLGGLVCITAGCDAIPPEWSALVGFLAGLGVEFWSAMMQKLKVDDPVDASAVHGFCGCLGVLCVGFFHREQGLLLGGGGDLLLAQVKGISAIIGYVGGTSFVYFYVVHAFGLLRMNMVVEVMGVDYYEFKDGAHDDYSEVEMLALQEYHNSILNTLQGDIWGLELEVAIQYAKTHRRVTVFFLCVAMFYNYFYYAHFEWRGWTFFSIVNLAVGSQCAAASHCEFKCRAASLDLKIFAGIVVMVGIGLSICNFAISPADNLPMAWIRTLTLSFAWSIWMHLRMQPVDWESVCMNNWKVAGDPNAHQDCITGCWIYLGSLFATDRAEGCWGYIASLFMVGRIQHIFESAFTYASVTSDLWVGLDEFRMLINDDGGSIPMGLLLVFFSGLQMGSVISRLFVPHQRRSIRFFQIVLLLTTVSEVPIAVIVFFQSDSDMKWVSVGFSGGSVLLQMFNLLLAYIARGYQRRRSIRVRTPPAESIVPSTRLKQASICSESTRATEPSSRGSHLAEAPIVQAAAPLPSPVIGGETHHYSVSSGVSSASTEPPIVIQEPVVSEGELPSSKPVAPDHVLERAGLLNPRSPGDTPRMVSTTPRMVSHPPPPPPPLPDGLLPPNTARGPRDEPKLPKAASQNGLLVTAQTPRPPRQMAPMASSVTPPMSARAQRSQPEPFGTPLPSSR